MDDLQFDDEPHEPVEDGEEISDKDGYDSLFTAETIGLTLAFGDQMRRENAESLFDHSDEDNEELMPICVRKETGAQLRPFEQYVRDIIEGRRSLFEK